MSTVRSPQRGTGPASTGVGPVSGGTVASNVIPPASSSPTVLLFEQPAARESVTHKASKILMDASERRGL
jgi:hypothetical protein